MPNWIININTFGSESCSSKLIYMSSGWGATEGMRREKCFQLRVIIKEACEEFSSINMFGSLFARRTFRTFRARSKQGLTGTCGFKRRKLSVNLLEPRKENSALWTMKALKKPFLNPQLIKTKALHKLLQIPATYFTRSLLYWTENAANGFEREKRKREHSFRCVGGKFSRKIYVLYFAFFVFVIYYYTALLSTLVSTRISTQNRQNS